MVVQIGLVMFLTACIHATDTFNYAMRLAGVRISKYAIAISLTTIIALVSRTSNLIQGPLTGSMIDKAKMHQNGNLFFQLQLVLSGAIIGTLIAVFLFPTLISLGIRMIGVFEKSGSILRIPIKNWLEVVKQTRLKLPRIKQLSFEKIKKYKNLLIINTLITGIFTVGVLSAQYASYLIPEYSTMAASSAGLINGIALILIAVFFDPKIAFISDSVMSGKTDMSEINDVYALVAIGRLLGTVLAQFLLFPAASFIALVCSLIP
ncbi:Protein of unknown function [Paenibacillaceae bacterium GAS479]|nr:Protein of unknown function [Paenibacillaceae bacterium GAS479]